MGRKDSKYRGTECLNCKTPLDFSEKYCHYCGQLNSTKKITLSDFIEEFFANFYAYDSKLRNSIISIFTKPGILAKRFNNGERTNFANPFRLFLSVSILLFLSFSLTEINHNENKNDDFSLETKKDSIISETTFLKKTEIKKLKDLHTDSIYSEKTLEDNCQNSFKLIKYKILSFKNFYNKNPNLTSEKALDSLKFKKNRLNKFLYLKAKTFKSNEIEEEILDYFYEKLPFLIFLSLPFITIIFWLVFYKKDLNYTEHLIFVYSFYTFIFICFILFNIIGIFSEYLSGILIFLCFLVIFPYYLYRSLRNFYQFSRWITIFKLLILHPLFAISFLFVMFIAFVLGVMIK